MVLYCSKRTATHGYRFGNECRSRCYTPRDESTEKAFNAAFWNGKAYRHPDYRLKTDDRVQALAIVSGLADKEKYPALIKVLKQNEHASPYMEKYVIEALLEWGKIIMGWSV